MWKLEPSERIACWRDFRKSLDSLSFEDALLRVAEYWQSCPYNAHYLDPEKYHNWPTPWELIAENYYCDLAKACGMLYTIYFTQHKSTIEADIRVYKDTQTDVEYNLAVFSQGKYMLNFRDGTVVNIESINKNLAQKYCFSIADLKLEEY